MFINKERLASLFCELAKIKSPSGQEEEIVKIVSEKLLTIGLKVERDNYGNIVAKLDGKGKPLILSGHLDTVDIGEGTEIVPIIDINKNIITSDGTTILGADNKDSVSAIIEVLTVLSENKIVHRPLEIIFTLKEEAISEGAKNLDYSLLTGKECVISDYAGEYGSVIIGAPYCFLFDITVVGKRSHVKEPEKGVNAIEVMAKIVTHIPLGRIDELTTSNIAYQVSGLKGVIDEKDRTIESLVKLNRNTVPDLAILHGEVRGPDLNKIKDTLIETKKVAIEIADNMGAKIICDTKKIADGYIFSENNALVYKVSQIFKAQGVIPKFVYTIGGSDANIFNANNICTIVISSAHKDNHRFTETLYVDNLVQLADLYLQLAQNRT